MCPSNKCDVGQFCNTAKDCATENCGASGKCEAKTEPVPQPNTCSNNVQDGDETSIDCGGSCEQCGQDLVCKQDSDCKSWKCVASSGSPEKVCAGNGCESALEKEILINEVFTRPDESKKMEHSDSNQMKFIELYNASGKRVSLNNLTITVSQNGTTHDIKMKGCMDSKTFRVLYPTGKTLQSLDIDATQEAVELDFLDVARHRRVVERVHVDAVRGYKRNVAVLEVYDLARMRNDRGDVARNDGLVLSNADDERASLARDDHLPGVAHGDNGDSVRSLDLLERLRHRREEVVLVELRYEVREHFGVRLGRELDAALLEARAESRVVLDDSVVDERETSAVRNVRMGVRGGGQAMRRPSRVRDADLVRLALDVRQLALQELLKFCDLAGLLEDAYAVLRLERDARRIVSAVLEAAKAVDQRTDRRMTPA